MRALNNRPSMQNPMAAFRDLERPFRRSRFIAMLSNECLFDVTMFSWHLVTTGAGC